MKTLSWQEFEAVDIRVGTIVRVEPFPKARKPAYKIWVDLGEEIGVKQSSAQITDLYGMDELPGRQVLCVVNFAPKQVADFMSEVLVTGFIQEGGQVVLAQPDRKVPNGLKLA